MKRARALIATVLAVLCGLAVGGCPGPGGPDVPERWLTLTYDGNGSTSGTPPASGRYEAGTTVNVSGRGDLIRSGHMFSGWNTTLDGTGTEYDARSTLTMGASDLELFAQWAAIDYTRAFVSVWDTRILTQGLFPSSPDTQLRLPLTEVGRYDFEVDWGDDTEDHIIEYDEAAATHTYATPGIYEVKIWGAIDGFAFRWSVESSRDKGKIVEIKAWGPLRIGNTGEYFLAADSLKISATDLLDLTGTSCLSHAFEGCSSLVTVPGMESWDVSAVTDMRYMFFCAVSFDQSIGGWDVSSVTNMQQMFGHAEAFNQDISGWDVSNVTDMSCMFQYAYAFDQPIGGWDVSSVTNMHRMFNCAGAFNQDIGVWDVSNVTDMSWMFHGAVAFNQAIDGWDVSSVNDMSGMFSVAPAFNQDISGWDVSKVTDMGSMFCDATAFNQPIGGWNVSSVVDMSEMFYGIDAFDQDIGAWDVSNVADMTDMLIGVTLSTANYDNLLIGWAARSSLRNGVVFHGGSSRYTASGPAESARLTLTTNWGWTITDGGPAP